MKIGSLALKHRELIWMRLPNCFVSLAQDDAVRWRSLSKVGVAFDERTYLWSTRSSVQATVINNHIVWAHHFVYHEKFLKNCFIALKPRMCQSCLGRWSHVGVLVDHLLQQILAQARNITEVIFGFFGFALCVKSEYGVLSLCWEQIPARQ